jgi:hypothetical protein
MSIKNILSYPLKNWIRPIALMYAGLPLFIPGALANIGILQLIGGGILFLGYFFSLISIFYLLYKREGWKAFYTLIFILLTIMIFGLMAG